MYHWGFDPFKICSINKPSLTCDFVSGERLRTSGPLVMVQTPLVTDFMRFCDR